VFVLMVSLCYVCVVSLAAFCSEVKILLETGAQQQKEVPDADKLKLLAWRMGAVQTFASLFLATSPLFIAFAAPPLLRHKVSYLYFLVCLCESVPEMFALITQMKKCGSGAARPASTYSSSDVKHSVVVYKPSPSSSQQNYTSTSSSAPIAASTAEEASSAEGEVVGGEAEEEEEKERLKKQQQDV